MFILNLIIVSNMNTFATLILKVDYPNNNTKPTTSAATEIPIEM